MVFLRESYLIHPVILLLFDPFVTAASAFWGNLSNQADELALAKYW